MRDGEQASFEAEVLPHLDAAYRVALSLTHRQDEAEDLVQDSCVRALRGYGGFRRGSNGRAWLLTIVRNTYFNLRRQAKSHPPGVPIGAMGERVRGFEPADDRTPGPEEQAIRSLERERLLRALAVVPEPFRSAVVLVDLGDLSYADAARVLGCPRGTIMSRLHRGRLLLAERLGIRSEEHPGARRLRHGGVER